MAHRVAAQLKRRGFRAVAVSGSLARGDAGPGSDVDLWAIGPSSGRDERFVGGAPVTVFRSTPRQLRDERWVNRWDVERLVVLFDARGDFARLRQRCARNRARLRRALEQATLWALRSAPPERAAWLEFSLAVFRATGTRVPKWKHAVALLPKRELAALRKKLRLPRRIDRAALLRDVRRAPAEVSRLLKRPIPRWAGTEQQLEHGSVEEAVLKLRSELAGWLGDRDVSRSAVLRRLLAASSYPRPG